MTDIIKQLATVTLFKGLDASQLGELAGIITDRQYKRSQNILFEGDPGAGFYAVITGKVKVFKVSPDGKEQILHIFGPGDAFAEVAVFSGSIYPANAAAIETSRLLFFPKDGFVALIKKNPQLAMNMLAALSMRLKRFSNLIESLSLKEVPGRLAAHLLYMRDRKHADTFDLGIPKSQLASLLGTIPETISRIFAKMSKQQLIRIKGPVITILDAPGLEDLATGETRL